MMIFVNTSLDIAQERNMKEKENFKKICRTNVERCTKNIGGFNKCLVLRTLLL